MIKVPKEYRAPFNKMWRIFAYTLGAICLLLIIDALGLFGSMPSISDIENPSHNIASEIFSSDGQLLGRYYIENRTLASFDEIPMVVKNALIATEDKRFREHSGVDAEGVFGGFFYTLQGKKRGASTITQQLALNLYSERARNPVLRLFQKINESILAVKLEKRYTKDEILNLYLNTVQFSENSYGIKTAAHTYYNKIPDSLTIDEAAMLVGVLNGITIYNPHRNPKLAIERRNLVLYRMKEAGDITEAQYNKLKVKPIVLHYQSTSHNDGLATYFREYMRLWLNNWCKDHTKPDGTHYNIYTDGLRIYTTIDSRLQKYAEEAVHMHMREVQHMFNISNEGKWPWGKNEDFIFKAARTLPRYKELKEEGLSDDSIMLVMNTKTKMTVFSYRGDRDTLLSPLDSIRYMTNFLQTGFLAIDPATGNIKAWVGGIDHHYFQYDHVNIDAKRQVGSTFKPFVYAMAIENGISRCQSVANERIVFPNYNNWSPTNSDGKYGGYLTLDQGLANSVNTITAWIMKQIGPKPVIDLARHMGIQSKLPPYPSLALGTADISLYEMVAAYCTFANKGVYTEPEFLLRVEDRNGNVLEEFHPKHIEAMSEGGAYTMTRMLQGVIKHGTGVGLLSMGLTGDIFGKTGTTQKNTDGWFIGGAPKLVAGGWVGGDERVIRFRTMLFGQGAYMALPTWGYFMQKVYADPSLGISPDDVFERPDEEAMKRFDCDSDNNDNNGDNTQTILGGDSQ